MVPLEGNPHPISPNDGGFGADEISSWRFAIAVVCLIWYLIVVLVCSVGYVQLLRFYSSVPRPADSANRPLSETPHVTILRPVKGQEPALYECLASTFHQTYPREKLTIFFCVSSTDDIAFQLLQRLIADFPAFDAKILVESEDRQARVLGPNPKIRNLSRGYREAKGDIVWVIDCNVWVGKGVAGRMVDKLCGFSMTKKAVKKYKFVHQLPLAVDVGRSESVQLLPEIRPNGHQRPFQVASTSTEIDDVRDEAPESTDSSFPARHGGRLEELFLSSSHAKFYTAINTILLAPCIVGKSNMFRRSHLDHLTASDPSRGRPGIDYFSDNICEDHLIGDLLWKGKVTEEEAGEHWGKHALVFGDLVIQPVAHMSIKEYIARRVRWLRVRKFTVTLATLVEPGTESFLCSAYGAYAATTLPFFTSYTGTASPWTTFTLVWLLSTVLWASVDWNVYLRLHSGASFEVDEHSPSFVRPPPGSSRRPFIHWLLAWLGREALAFPIWAWAVLGGTTVTWRGKRFWVGTDMRVHAIEEEKRPGRTNGHVQSKKRRE